MRLSAALLFALVMALPSVAQAGERRRVYREPAYDQPQYRSEAERRAGIWRRNGERVEGRDDTPYGPRYQTQEQVQQSMYDFSLGRRGNIKEYWWR
jgi:hypothetical protein